MGVIWEFSYYEPSACTCQKQSAYIRDYLNDDYPPRVTHFYLSIFGLFWVCQNAVNLLFSQFYFHFYFRFLTMQRYKTSTNTSNKFCNALVYSTCDIHEETSGGAKRPREERLLRGGLRRGARGAGASDLAPRMCGGLRGEERAHRANPRPPSGTEHRRKRGNHPPPGSDRRERRGGGTGGRGQGARPTSGGNDPDKPTAGAAHRQNSHSRPNIRARTRREASKAERREQRAEASVASRSESDYLVAPLP